MIIRRATLEDADSIADIYLASRKQHVSFAPLAHTDRQVRDFITNVVVRKMHTTVAEIDGEIVGMCTTVQREHSWVEHLYLAPDRLREGIGSVLLMEAIGRLSPPIRLFTFQANTIACRFYEKHGFVAIQFGDGSDNEEGVPDVLYELS